MLNLEIEIKNIKFFNKGKRSLVYTGKFKNKKVGIKIKNPKSLAKSRIENEGKFLKILNKYNIGPKIIKSKKDYVVYKFIEGKPFIEELPKVNKNDRINLILSVLDQCRTLDKLKINKLEFTRPIKHLYIKNKKVKMIDFERCYFTKSPKNLTQFCNFLISKKMNKILKINKENLIKILKEYKKNQTEKNYKLIKKLIKISEN